MGSEKDRSLKKRHALMRINLYARHSRHMAFHEGKERMHIIGIGSVSSLELVLAISAMI